MGDIVATMLKAGTTSMRISGTLHAKYLS